MESNTTSELGQSSDNGRLAGAPRADEITPVKSQVTSVEGDGIEHMTLNTAVHSLPVGAATVPIPQKGLQPLVNSPPPAKPENYVVALEKLGESPDFIDCPWCQKRQKTKVVHTDSSMTTYAPHSSLSCMI